MTLNTLGSLITYNAKNFSKKAAFACEGRTLTFSEFNARVNRLINALGLRGMRKGDRLGILSTNRTEMVEAYGAAEKAGYIAVPMNFRYERAEIAYIIQNAEPSVIIVESEYAHLVESFPAERTYVFSADAGAESGYERLLASSDASEPYVTAGPDDIVYMMYTGGTTGKPKGVLLDQRGQLENAKVVLAEAGIGPDDRLLTVMPLYHIGGKNFTTAHFHRGCTNVLVPAFRAPRVLQLFRDHQITCVLLAPTMIKMLVDELGGQPFTGGGLKSAYYSSAPMPVALLRQAIKAFGPVFMQFYGLTETGPSGTALRKEDHVPDGTPQEQRRLMSAGRASPYNEISIVDEAGRELPPGQVGEVRIRAQQVMRGYWRNDEATCETLRDGWIYSGDFGEMDHDGYLYVVGRKKDVIISGGENIYPREIEELLSTRPEIREVAVIGLPDDKWGEAVAAFVVLNDGASLSNDQVIEFCRANLASYKKPRSVFFREALPRSSLGKIVKASLRDEFWGGRDRKI